MTTHRDRLRLAGCHDYAGAGVSQQCVVTQRGSISPVGPRLKERREEWFLHLPYQPLDTSLVPTFAVVKRPKACDDARIIICLILTISSLIVLVKEFINCP